MRQSESIKGLAAALAKAQAEMPSVTKSKDNPFFKSKYADLAACVDVAVPILTKHGLSFAQFAESSPDGTMAQVTTMLMHGESGEWISGMLTMKPSKSDPQGIASATTYAKRYGFSAIIGLVSDDDDDGNGAATPPAQRSTPKNGEASNGTAKTATPKSRFAGLIRQWSGVKAEDLAAAAQSFAKHCGVSDVGKATAAEYERLFNEASAAAESGKSFLEVVK